ncbi:nucleotidyltransferase family protein [Cellulomonas xiejunii]|uniref:nucleotidyltransferase family protein n=1 Tax=Cellulomonas xiejunii TaxID=2968083 RepID=UPI001D0E31B9|nr:nucleotidyltransferase family protein [Cellulomonas xiejunii]MCC2314164.1 nucleotidyltransferase family protein [Cellulomonas xiejunii]
MQREILINVARFDRSWDDQIASALEQLDDGEWAELLALASTHRIMANLARIVDGMTTVPGNVAAFCAKQHGHLRRESALRGEESDAVVEDLAAAGARPIALKGYVLARQCYSEPWLREVGDLDLLVRPEHLALTAGQLLSAGYKQSEQTTAGDLVEISDRRLQGYEQELQHLGEFTKPGPGGPLLSIDVHFRLSTVFDHLAPRVEVFLANTVTVDGRGYEQFRPELFVAHLAYHAWWDTQSLRNVNALADLRLCQYSDILLAFKKWDLNCEDVLEWAERAGVGVVANWALWLTGNLFGDLARQHCVRVDDAREFDAIFADRWTQRSTESALGTWRQPAPDRMFDRRRPEQATAMFLAWVNSHLARGDRLDWTERDA